MDKRSAMEMVNEHLGNRLLSGRNTSFANISGPAPKWWMTIDPSKFKSDLHLLLAKEGDGGLIWLRIKGNAFPDVSKVFRVRQDNGHKGSIDWEISSRPPKYMTDVKSGGTEYDFTKHIEHEWGRPYCRLKAHRKRMSSERVKALWEFGKAIFGRNNLIGTDFSDVLAHKALRSSSISLTTPWPGFKYPMRLTLPWGCSPSPKGRGWLGSGSIPTGQRVMRGFVSTWNLGP